MSQETDIEVIHKWLETNWPGDVRTINPINIRVYTPNRSTYLLDMRWRDDYKQWFVLSFDHLGLRTGSAQANNTEQLLKQLERWKKERKEYIRQELKLWF